MSKLALALIKKAKTKNVTYLDLGCCGLNTVAGVVLERLLELTQLETLILSNSVYDFAEKKWNHSQNEGKLNQLSAIPNLSQLKNLKNLSIGGSGRNNKRKQDDFWHIKEINNLSQLSSLEKLQLGYSRLSDISVLEKLTLLHTLDLSYNNISNISVLEKLTLLHTLDLSSNRQIQDFSVLEKLTLLHTLDLSYNNISNISVLEKLTLIHTLDLSSNRQIQDFSVLEKLTLLHTLDLSYNNISNISVLEKLTLLHTLDLSSNRQIQDFSVLEKLTLLHTLDLSYNNISNISVLEKLTLIHTLDLSNNRQIQDFSVLEKLTLLHTLDLSSNNISNISVLEKLKLLHTLDLSSNRQIQDFSVLEKLTLLHTLDLSYNNISNISVLEKLTLLHTLDLSYNNISNISVLEKLTLLHTLDLRYNNISNISVLEKLKLLHTLDLSDNNISNISVLEKLKLLHTLDLSNNRQIQDFSVLEKLTLLHTLDLSYNRQIQDFSVLEKLTLLHTLDLSDNNILNISVLEKLTLLHTLDLRSNNISNISVLEKLKLLHTLDLSDNNISNISVLEKLKLLHTLDLSNNRQIQDFSVLEKLTLLHTLDLSYNNISNISVLEKLKLLHTLDLSDNNISNISVLEKLTLLHTLDLSNNRQIQDFSVLEKLTLLHTLDLSSNNISNISVLEKLTLLHTLYLHSNNIVSFEQVENITQLPELNSLYLYGNPVKGIPKPELGVYAHTNCLPILKNYFKDGQIGYITNKTIKTIMVGNGCVGKTTIVKRLLQPEGEILPIPLEKRTEGIDIHTFPLEDWQINIWDFGGQDIYHATHRLFLSERTLYLLVWAANSPEKKDEPRYPPYYWMDYIADLGKRSHVIVVQNLFEGDKTGILADYEALKTAYEVSPYFLEFGQIQALNAHKVTNRTSQLTYEILDGIEKINERYSEKIPIPWGAIRQHIFDLRDVKKEKRLSWANYLAFCKKEKVGGSSPDTVIDWLHQTGEVYYKKGSFNDEIILDQQWAVDAVYNALKVNSPIRTAIKEKGWFDIFDARQQWSAQNTSEIQIFLDFMKSCELAFEKSEHQKQSKYIIPQLLNNDSKKGLLSAWSMIPDVLHCQIHYRFLHRSIIERFIVQIQDYSSAENIIWPDGIQITTAYGNALISSEPLPDEEFKKYLHIRVAGSQKEKLLYQIRKKLSEIRQFKEGGVRQQVSLDGSTFVDLAAIETAQSKGEEMLWVDGQNLPISDLAVFIQPTDNQLVKLEKPQPEKMIPKAPLKLFISYSKRDKAIADDLVFYLNQFKRDGELEIWIDNQLKSGDEWDAEIKAQLQAADVIVFMLSNNFLATNYIMDVEVTKAIERHDQGEATIMPIVLGDSNWTTDKYAYINKIQAIPAKGRSFRDFKAEGREDKFWKKIVEDIQEKIANRDAD